MQDKPRNPELRPPNMLLGSKSYQNSLSLDVSSSAGLDIEEFSAKFTLSYNYQYVFSTTSTMSKTLIQSSARCQRYTVNVLPSFKVIFMNVTCIPVISIIKRPFLFWVLILIYSNQDDCLEN